MVAGQWPVADGSRSGRGLRTGAAQAPMRVVLDTNVLVRANPKAIGSARALLDEIARSFEHALILSPFLVLTAKGLDEV